VSIGRFPCLYRFDGFRPTPAVQPPRARHKMTSKADDLAREAVGCNGLFGVPVAITRAASRLRRPHHRGITLCITGLNLNHAQHKTRLPITGTPHNEPSYHTLHNGRGHAARPAERAFRKRNLPQAQQKGMAITPPREPNVLRFSGGAL